MDRDIDIITTAYIECMLWADSPGELTGSKIVPSEIASETLKREAREDVEDFLGLLAREKVDSIGWSDHQLGRDFWLSRQRHGTGFFDRGLPAGEVLHKWAKTYGSLSVCIGDDGLLYAD